ncbi:MAG TPA: universal stress protein [Gemmataceae bacterium]|nr:universal stress protein [Gemmataceae bacterium]
MTPTVMAPLDGSPAAEAALPWAVLLARAVRGAVRLVGVHAPPAVFLDGETLVGSAVPDDAVRQKEAEYFATMLVRLKGTGVPVAAELLDGGVVSSLAEYARNLHPVWIVMTSHARGPVAKFFLGETATEFFRRSPCPVLLVHPTDRPADPAAAPGVHHVLVPLDGSALAETMVRPAGEFAKAIGADVTLITALAAAADMGPAGKAEAYLTRAGEPLRAEAIPLRCQVVAQGGAADVIVAEAKARPGTVVALATHGRGGLSKLVWGSVAEEVVRRSPTPVLVYKPSER